LALTASETIRNHAAFIWSVADLLRGDYKQSEYGRVILPLVVLRRLDCVLEPTKAKVVQTAARLEGKVANVDPVHGRRRESSSTTPLRSTCESCSTIPTASPTTCSPISPGSPQPPATSWTSSGA
jgi:hypothetical protein